MTSDANACGPDSREPERLARVTRAVEDHYTRGNLAGVILGAVEQAAADPAHLTIDDLAPADEFHIGGRAATVRLMEHLRLSPAHHVLDIGAGIGGAARYVAHTYGSIVTGIDLTAEYCDVANLLARRVGLASRVSVRHASALDLPFAPGTFDAAYMLHVGMNIADKPALFRQIHRVLKPGAVFGMYDILRGADAGPLQFPVPWATTPETSFLASIDETRTALRDAGFAIEYEADRAPFALEFFERLRAAGAGGPPPVGLHLLMGESMQVKVGNMIANVSAGRCGPWEIVARHE